jgi:hypothetical protein
MDLAQAEITVLVQAEITVLVQHQLGAIHLTQMALAGLFAAKFFI